MNPSEQIFFSLLSATVIAAIITLFGRWYMDRKFHDLGLTAKTYEIMLNSQIDFKERQRSEFYGPIYARLQRGQRLNALWRQGKLASVEVDVLALFVQANESNVQTILNQSQWIDGDAIPESYIRYLTHVAIWHPYLRRNPPEIPPYEREGFQDGQYPDDFEQAIVATTEKLKRELRELYKNYGLRNVNTPSYASV